MADLTALCACCRRCERHCLCDEGCDLTPLGYPDMDYGECEDCD